MTHLYIEQSKNIPEIVPNTVIKKLHEIAINVGEPKLGETDNIYLSGHIKTDKTYREYTKYLAGRIGFLGAEESNPSGRFQDLLIDVTSDYYIMFEDPNVESVLIANNISSDGIGITETDASTANLGTMFKDNTTITSFNEFGYFSKANNSPVNEMFKGCTNLESIDLSNITSISTSQFSGTAITDINAPDLVSYTGYTLFAQCTQLKTVSSLGHISTIPNSCFFGSYNLETVNLPDECISIELGGFYPRDNGNGSLTVVNGIGHILNFGYRAFYRLSNLHLYSQDLYNATNIGANAFWYVKIHSIDCPNLASLSSSAFRENTVLTNVDCLGKISSIPNDCFSKDTALQTVKLPYECTSITDYAFYNCSSLTNITQYNKSLDDYAEGESPAFTNISRITSFGDSCFEGCSLLSLTSQDIQNATTIGDAAFKGVLLSGTLNLPHLTSIGQDAFNGNTTIQTVSNLGNITKLPYGVFTNCTNLLSIVVPTCVTEYSAQAFANTPIDRVIMHEGVTKATFGQQPSGTSNLAYIELPTTVTDMDCFFHNPYYGGSNNKILVIKATTPPSLTTYNGLTGSSENGVRKFSAIYVPSVSTYLAGSGFWQNAVLLAKLKPISDLLIDSPTWWAVYQSGLSNS